MKKQVVILGMIASLVTVGLSGCNDASNTLNPEIKIMDKSKIKVATLMHRKANEMCFIANSLNFPVLHKPSIESIN